VEDDVKAVLDYEAQLNRRDMAELPAPPSAVDPVAAAERLIAGVRIELRNRRKLAAIVPQLLDPVLEEQLLNSVEARIAADTEVLRKQIEHRHYFSGAGSRTPPELVAAHQGLVDAQRRGATLDYGRLFPDRAAPDYTALESFRVRAAAAAAIVRTEFGLMRLRATMGAPNPGEASAFDHIAVNLVAVIRDIGAAADGLRIRSGRHAGMALAMQWFAAAIVCSDGVTPQERLQLARSAQKLTRTALMPAGGRDDGRALIAEIGGRAAKSRLLGETWQKCGTEAVRFFER
jgi:hypothetical protein